MRRSTSERYGFPALAYRLASPASRNLTRLRAWRRVGPGRPRAGLAPTTSREESFHACTQRVRVRPP
ncbi:hypothetical protein ADK49_04875 [Streptomyces sp. WM6349]|nr:hypothetical protein ADK49_04875 [Streptomyces sp. WM6349]KOV53844.1 hypothetical protein ADK98_03910 [Streptomyces sp. H036]